MKLPRDKQKRFSALFNLPPFIGDMADRFFEPADVEFVLGFADAFPDGLEGPEVAGADPAFSGRALRNGLRRGLLRLTDSGGYAVADFHARFEIWALFEGWKDIPDGMRRQLLRWELEAYIHSIAPQVAALKSGAARNPQQVWPTYLLMDEVQAVLARAPAVYLWPCNCRAMVQGCSQSRYTCLRFENPQGIGWAVSRERAFEIAQKANRQGLMQSGELGLAPDGTLVGAICNCCTDCCFPHQAARVLEAEKRWPYSRYVAEHIEERCTACGRCSRRCPFGAFETMKAPLTQERKKRLHIVYHPERCRGCGLCATGCPEAAVRMVRTGMSVDAFIAGET